MNTKKLPLTLESDTLNAFKTDFNQMLRKLLSTMEMQDAEEGVLTAKMNISLKQDKARDYQANGYDGTRDITKPTFAHKIGISLQFKDEKSGTLGGNYEMVWDKELQAYVMMEINNGQTSLFEKDEKKEAPAEEVPAEEAPTEEAPTEADSEAQKAFENGKAFAAGIAAGMAEAKQIDGSVVGAPALPEATGESDPEVDYIDAEITDVVESPADPEPDADAEAKKEIQEHFDHIAKYVGQDMRIFVNGDMSSIRSAKGGNIILTSVGTAKDIFRADHETIAKHEGHEVVCTGDWIIDNDGSRRLIRIVIKCLECDEVLWSMDNPKEEHGYEYDKPES